MVGSIFKIVYVMSLILKHGLSFCEPHFHEDNFEACKKKEIYNFLFSTSKQNFLFPVFFVKICFFLKKSSIVFAYDKDRKSKVYNHQPAVRGFELTEQNGFHHLSNWTHCSNVDHLDCLRKPLCFKVFSVFFFGCTPFSTFFVCSKSFFRQRNEQKKTEEIVSYSQHTSGARIKLSVSLFV